MGLIIFVQVESKILLPRLHYVLDFINGHPLLDGKMRFVSHVPDKDHLTLYYGQTRRTEGLFLPAQRLFFTKKVVEIKALCLNAFSYQQSTVYSVEGKERKERPFFEDFVFAFDVFETLFFHLSRYEECFPEEGKARELKDLLVKRTNLEQEPLVDQLILAMARALGMDLTIPATAFVLTHDIDKIYKYNHFWDAIKAFVWPIVYRLNPIWGWRNIIGYYQLRRGESKDPYDTYRFLFRSGSAWRKKIVYFMAGGESSFDLYDLSYAQNLPKIWEMAREKGYEIGLHPSYHTAGNEKMMAQEKQNLEKLSKKNLRNTRQHFLRFLFPISSQIIENNGFELDSTLGFTRWIGFRSGTGFEHHLYDFDKEKAFTFYVLPLVVMDSSLIHQTRDDMEAFRSVLFAFLDRHRSGTQITFNFHNSTFDSTLKKRQKLISVLEELEGFIRQ